MSPSEEPIKSGPVGAVKPLELLISELSSGEYGDAIASITSQLREEAQGETAAVIDALPDRLFAYILDRLAPHSSADQLALIRKAFDIASKAHEGAVRDDGSPYITHPLRVAISIIDDPRITEWEVVCIALLHDVVEDSSVSRETIKEIFGDRIFRGVVALSKNEGESLPENLARIAEAADTGAPYVKVADRIDNLRTAVYRHKLGKRLEPIEETEKHFLSFASTYAPELRDELLHAVAHATYLVRHTELYQDGFRSVLRAAVRDLHETLGGLDILKELDTPGVTKDSYLKYLKKVWGLLEPIEDVLVNSPLASGGFGLTEGIRWKANLIREDMIALGATDSEIACLPKLDPVPPLATLPQILGVLYTIEGSLLGGIAIRGNVEPALGVTEELGASFLNTYGDVASTSAHFESFMASLERLASSAEDMERFQEEIVLSGVDMFIQAHAWYR